MKTCAIIFDDLPWTSQEEGMRCKVYVDGAKQLRLVEISEAFVEENWCTAGHVGMVLVGELEVAFAEEVLRFPQGAALVIPPGEAHAHRARAVTSVVTLFLVEDAPP